jgi:HAD superfamily hydrolase (TIGR01484 family)
MSPTPRLIAFDLDDTLAPSKTRLPDPMADALKELLAATEVAIISGGNLGQFQNQVLTPLGEECRLAGLHLLPTCGTQYLRYEPSGWVEVYREELTADQRDRALSVLRRGAMELGLWSEQTWGPILEDRGSQITFSALGQQAPVDAKKAWDPDNRKKAALRDYCAALLPDLEVRSGGSTSVDVTRIGIDKGYGMSRLIERTCISREEMLFYGDRLDPGGNDRPVLDMGIPCVSVDGWQDTEVRVRELAHAYGRARAR